MGAILANIESGDEIIMPSFTFVSTANAFVLCGAEIVFVDIKPDTMNIDENLIEKAITKKTKVIVPVHYAGVACEMDKIIEIAREYNFLVIEDAAQGVMAKYKNKFLGTIGHLGCYSFHETKNYTCGEGGALSINSEEYFERAEIIREKGTNRMKYLRGEVDKYTWVDIGSSYLMSEISAAFLLAQLKNAKIIEKDRLRSWNTYYKLLKPLEEDNFINLPVVPNDCHHSGHMFYIKAKDLEERTKLIDYLNKCEINAVFHYVPLHTSIAGKKYGRFYGKDIWTTKESERILRLPMYYGLKYAHIEKVVNCINTFYQR